jgi:NTE family protein
LKKGENIMANKKTAFVLSGGGLRGCFQVGALKYLMEEKKIKPDIVCGISTGSLQAVGVALGIDLENLWTKKIKKTSDVYSACESLWTGISLVIYYLVLNAICAGILCIFLAIYPACIIASVISAILFYYVFKCFIYPGITLKSFFNLSGLKKILEKYLKNNALENSSIDLFIGSVDLMSSVLTYHAKDEITIQEILASCAIPAMFPPVTKGNMQSVDGGVRDIAPMRIAIRNGARDIYVIMCDPFEPHPHPQKINNILDVLNRSLAIICHEIIINDIETTIRKNELTGKSRYEKIKVHVIDPDAEFMEFYSDILNVNHRIIKRGIEKGKERAKASLDNGPVTKKRIDEILHMISPTGESAEKEK